MELRTAVSPRDVKTYTTQILREEFLIQGLFVPGEIKLSEAPSMALASV